MKRLLLFLMLAGCTDGTAPGAEPSPRAPYVAGNYEIRSVDGVATPAPAPPMNDCDGLYTTTSGVTFRTDSTFIGRIIQRYECPRSTLTTTAVLEGTYSVMVGGSILMRPHRTGNVDEAWAAPGAVHIVWRKDDAAPFDTLGFAVQ